MARLGHDRFEPLWRAIDAGLAAEGWRRTKEDGPWRTYARDVSDGLCLSLWLHRLSGEGPEVLDAEVTIRCPAAQKLLERLGSFATAAIRRDLDLDVDLDGALDQARAAREWSRPPAPGRPR